MIINIYLFRRKYIFKRKFPLFRTTSAFERVWRRKPSAAPRGFLVNVFFLPRSFSSVTARACRADGWVRIRSGTRGAICFGRRQTLHAKGKRVLEHMEESKYTEEDDENPRGV